MEEEWEELEKNMVDHGYTYKEIKIAKSAFTMGWILGEKDKKQGRD